MKEDSFLKTCVWPFLFLCVLAWLIGLQNRVSRMEERQRGNWEAQTRFNNAVIQTFNTPKQ